MKVIETERLILRTWKEEDIQPYFQINQDPKVIEFLLPMSLTQIQEFITRMNNKWEKYGHTFWAAELKDTGELIGFIGLNYVEWEAEFTPAVDIGWRLASQHWGKGYATEAAKASLDYGFNKCHLKEILAFTVLNNIRSINVMEKIGMTRDFQGDFLHPRIEKGHKLSKHILYRIQQVTA